MSDVTKQAKDVIDLGLYLGIGLGIVGFVLYELQVALGSNAGGNFVGNVLGSFTTPVQTILPAVITLMFVGMIAFIGFSLYKHFKGTSED